MPRQVSKETLPFLPHSTEGRECVRQCLKADGHPPASELIAEWIWHADEARRCEIRRIINGAVSTTIHLWA
jgi:hypothetical protein